MCSSGPAASVQRIITLGFFDALLTRVGPAKILPWAPRARTCRFAGHLSGHQAFHSIRQTGHQAIRPSDKQCAAKDGDGIPGQADSLFVDIHADVSAALGRLEAEQSAASEVWLPERCQCAVCGPGDRIFGDSAGWGEEA